MCEFAANNSFSESTKSSPFLVNYSYHPRFLDILAPQDKYPAVPWATSLATELVDLYSALRAEMNYAQLRQAEYANNSRLPAPRYDPGDMVWLLSRNFHTQCPSCKLDYKLTYPYEILVAIGTHAYQVKFL